MISAHSTHVSSSSSKGTTLLNYFNIGRDYLSFVVDRSTVKQGLFTPGTLLEIKHPDALLKGDISHALLLAWNFAEEIMNQQQLFINKGGKFILPLPTVQVLS